MGSPIPSSSPDINTQVQPTSSQGSASIPDGSLFSPGTVKQLIAFFEGKSGGISTEAIGGTTTLQSMKIADKEIGLTTTTRDILNIHNPNLPAVHEELVTIAMTIITTNGEIPGTKEFESLGKAVFENMKRSAPKGTPENDFVNSLEGPGGTPPPHVCAFLGGLAMVALAEILADYAKNQSAMNKLMSTLWIQTEMMLKDIAKEMHDQTLDKMHAQVSSLMMQAAFSACAIAIQVGGSMKAFNQLGKMERNVDGTMVHAYGAETKAGITNTLTGAGAQIFSGIGTNLTKAWETTKTGTIEAEMITEENLKQMLEKMVDKFTQAGNDAQSKTNEAYQLMKDLFSALTQAFRSLTGR
jgi:hypothetical protein